MRNLSREILLSLFGAGLLCMMSAQGADTPDGVTQRIRDDLGATPSPNVQVFEDGLVISIKNPKGGQASQDEAGVNSKTSGVPSSLVDETIAEVNDLLELSKPAKDNIVEFGDAKEPLTFQRPITPANPGRWSKNDASYRDFEAVEVEEKSSMELAPRDTLLFEEPLNTTTAGGAETQEGLLPKDDEIGIPGLVYTQEQQKDLNRNERAAAAAAAARQREFAELDGEVVDDSYADVEMDSTALDENAEEIQRRLLVDDDAPAPVHTGDKWYVPLNGMTHVQVGRRDRLRECLDFYYSRMLNTRDDSPWSMMHHMIAWGTDSRVWVGPPGSRHESCIGWLCANGPCEGERLLFVKNDLLSARTGPGLQGHTGQFLAMLAQTRVRADQPIQVDGRRFTVKDLIKQEQLSCRPATELTFKLIGLVHYLDTDASWKSSDGQDWNIERLINEEMRQPINGTTCGGTHRLMGMTYAIRRRQQEGKPLDGEFQRASVFTARYRQMAYDMQNADGTFSSDFWRSRGHWGDMDRKLKTTGHVLEWMIFSLPHEELQDPRLVAAVDWLSKMMLDNRYYDFEKGPIGHGIRALSLYDERVYGGTPGKRNYEVAEMPPRLTPRSGVSNVGPPQATTSPAPTPQPQRRRGIFGGFRRR